MFVLFGVFSWLGWFVVAFLGGRWCWWVGVLVFGIFRLLAVWIGG